MSPANRDTRAARPQSLVNFGQNSAFSYNCLHVPHLPKCLIPVLSNIHACPGLGPQTLFRPKSLARSIRINDTQQPVRPIAAFPGGQRPSLLGLIIVRGGALGTLLEDLELADALVVGAEADPHTATMLLIDDWIPWDALLCIWIVRVDVRARFDLVVMDNAGAVDLGPDSLVADELAGAVGDVVLGYPGVVT